MSVWLNVDIRTSACTIHTNCVHTAKKKETARKGIGSYKADGGWLEMRSKEHAVAYSKSTHPNYKLIEHC